MAKKIILFSSKDKAIDSGYHEWAVGHRELLQSCTYTWGRLECTN